MARKVFTKAVFATHVASIGILASQHSSGLAQGMWNPNFCAASATDLVEIFCNELEARIKHMRAHIKNVETTPADD